MSLAPGEKNNAGARERERVRQVAAGRVREFRLEGLTPATEYQVAVQAVSDKVCIMHKYQIIVRTHR